jgi:methylenetetrahydrofolate reductase (NADPH)
MTAKDAGSLRAAAPGIPPGTVIAVTFLPGEKFAARAAAAKLVHDLGFEPMPHFSARGLRSLAEFEDYLGIVTAEARVKRCFVIAGDDAAPKGPFHDSIALIASGAFERCGIRAIGVGGHPEGHPHMTEAQSWQILAAKCAEIGRRGMAPFIVTQFGFDAERVISWLTALRAQGIGVPVRLGIPGPAGVKTLMRFAARCGVGASSSVLAKYGVSIGKLLGTAGPDKFTAELLRGIGPEHGPVQLHFYPFGGMEKTMTWIHEYGSGSFKKKEPKNFYKLGHGRFKIPAQGS